MSLVSVQDIQYINKIITSAKYSSKIDYKNQAIDYTMRSRGFRKLHAGTNRVVYKHEEIPNIVMKIPFREIALSDGLREYKNQMELQPFVTRIFDVTPCGTMALVERVQAITSIPEYLSLYDSIFELLVKKILGKYILEDIGSDYFKNIGIRDGFGPVLIDFPIMFKLDGNKLYCNKVHLNGVHCDGIIDYDDGFNKLVCKKCGQRYYASELQKYEDENKIVKGYYKKGDLDMRIEVRRGREIVAVNETKVSETIKSNVLDIEVVGGTAEEETVNTVEDKNNTTEENRPMTKVSSIYTEKKEDNTENIAFSLNELEDGEVPPEYLNIPGYGVYKLQSVLEIPEGEFMNPPESPVKDDYDENGNFKIEKEKVESTAIDARTDYEDDEEKTEVNPIEVDDYKSMY